MSEPLAAVRLPAELDTTGELDLAALNARLHARAARLDWAAVAQAEPEALRVLLAGLDALADDDVIGGDTIPEPLLDAVTDALTAIDGAPDRATERSGAPRPGLWHAPTEPEADEPPADAPDEDEPQRPTAPLLTSPGPWALREELQQLVLDDLLGPAGGPEEELVERRVSDRYLLGMLAPRGTLMRADDDDDVDVADDEAEEQPADRGVRGPSWLFPSSFGFSCTVDGAARELVLRAGWGRYRRTASASLLREDGEPERVWKREPVTGELRLPLLDGKIARWCPAADQRDVFVEGEISSFEGDWIVTVFLVNDQRQPQLMKDSAWLFQPELALEGLEGAPVFVHRMRARADRLLPADTDEPLRHAMLYRKRLEFAAGHGVSVHAESHPGQPDRAWRVSTVCVPCHELAPTAPVTNAEYPELAGIELDMRVLAELQGDALNRALAPLPSAYAIWITEQRERLGAEPDLRDHRVIGQRALHECTKALERIRAGIRLVVEDTQAGDAFRFMNRAMAHQRVHTTWAEQRRRGGDTPLADLDVRENRSWRLFQLAFILMNLPGLTRLDHPERADDESATADLLWFPTGGGKTEAYLGLTAYTLAIRRLQGVVAGRDGEAGVAVLMRYTLRLLTLQQFQRATALICACELLRREASEQADHRWGREPFRIGLWVGSRMTPNRTEDAAEAISAARGSWAGRPAASGSPAQLRHCPWCGTAIDPGRDISVESFASGRGRTLLFCGDPLGRCPFSRTHSPQEGLPVVIVDEEIYRLLPALLIATVDKFAQLPWNGATQMLFGQVSGRCERHGFRSPELEDSDSHPARHGLPAARTQPAGPLRPPDLIIQDELHLISGPLGTLVGLYETAIDALATWEVDGQRVRPKVIASTATIRRAADQVQALFMRDVRVFPPHGLDAGDSFFASERPVGPATPGRRYIGISAPGKRLKATLIRVYVAHLAAAQRLFEKYGPAADPYLTLVGYFGSMRELGGMRRLVEDDVRARLRNTDQRGLGRRTSLTLRELTSRVASSDIPAILEQLETRFTTADARPKRGERRPIDVLLATNMISVGVDVQRLGMMIVAGQPKSTAEYIQATSRVGRNASGPGLVTVVFNWARPRDLSHYERFEHYHATFYSQVEALSVTPFAPRALDRALSALLVALVRLRGTEFNANARAGALTRDHPYVRSAFAAIERRASAIDGGATVAGIVHDELQLRLDEWLHAASPNAGSVLGYREKRDGRTVGLLHSAGAGHWDVFTCLNSLRDVEPSVPLLLDDSLLIDDTDRDTRSPQ